MTPFHKMVIQAHWARKRSHAPPAKPQGEAIVVDRLTKVFPGQRRGHIEAAKDISFTCNYGEVFGLLGPNGAGKTTTLRMLATILRPTSGTASIAGRDVVAEPIAVRRGIGFLSGNTGLYQRFTARETLAYFGRLHGMPEGALEPRIESVLELLDMRSFADTRCERLSTGMRQKVSIARTILHDPPVLILDEPTLGLDLLVASTMIRFIEDCRRRGKCIIFSTHIMDEVQKLCDRIGIIHGGRLRALGTLAELREETGYHFLDDIFMAVLTKSTTKALQ